MALDPSPVAQLVGGPVYAGTDPKPGGRRQISAPSNGPRPRPGASFGDW